MTKQKTEHPLRKGFSTTIRLEGRVIFNAEGYLTFREPLKFYLEKLTFQLPVAPRHVKFQIDTNKGPELPTYVTIAIAFIQLFVASGWTTGRTPSV